jgi:hypothetical protein
VFYSVGGGELHRERRAPRRIFYAALRRPITRLDRRTGREREVSPCPDNPMGHARRTSPAFQWTFPIIAPTDPRIYVGSQHVWKSTSAGQSWKRISPGPRHDPRRWGLGRADRRTTPAWRPATVFAIAPSAKGEVIWSGPTTVTSGDAQRRHQLEEHTPKGWATSPASA